MTAKSPKPDTPLPESSAIESLLDALTHPLAADVRRLRDIIRTADPRVLEGVKWNAPSFFHRDWFATFHLRSPEEIAIILHRGAKVKRPLRAPFINDASGLVTWLAPDRGKVVFRHRAEIEQHQPAFAATIRTWLDQMDREHRAS